MSWEISLGLERCPGNFGLAVGKRGKKDNTLELAVCVESQCSRLISVMAMDGRW